ncbi:MULTISPECIES: helix-turn-helix domain-containing protein [unclassified Microbacterium]|uniref:helix-turn-helix domain-containing protein n=1 Tax=unclassified Microbacterium TaxID=2609290 RepID=UPI0016055268|nr:MULTISPECIES: XRE family transcriptional regulator [unclassified Microbacterium]QNA92965.1 helix-turn-helix domain-containing protein [Microbacterium sp. Se63.02b]QYM63130.1 XRE family transcriptional regulator [Microbacterium sp. Se5.02b]
MAAAVGARIRSTRVARRISLGSLASATGLGKGTLSELERGLRNPTLDTLFAIATCLGLPLSKLLVDDDAPGRGAPDAIHASGQSVDALLVDRWADAAALVEVYRLTISQETRHSLSHAPGVVEVLTVITGHVEVGVEGDTVHLRSTESHRFEGDRPHLYRGIAEKSSAILVMRYAMPDRVHES